MAKPIERLRQWMEWARLSRADVARETGLSRSTISMILRGERGVGLDAAVAIEAAMRRPRNDGAVYRRPVIQVAEWLS